MRRFIDWTYALPGLLLAAVLVLAMLGCLGCTACWEDGGGQDFRIGTCNPCQSGADPEVQDAGE